MRSDSLKIPCFFKPVLECEALRIRDTGASRTTICDKDVIRLGIDFDKLEKLSEDVKELT